MDIMIASEMLSELNLQIPLENYIADVKHFRVANMSTNNNIKRHTHSSFEYHIITSGRCRVSTDSGTFEVDAGEFYLTAPGVYHEQLAISSGGYIEYSLNVELRLLYPGESETDSIVKLLTETECKPIKDTQNIAKLFEQALYEAYHKRIGFFGSIKDLVHSIVIHSARAMCGNLSSNASAYVYKDNDFRLVLIERFIEDNISVNLTTDDISRYMCLSNKQICRIIKEKTGGGTKDLIVRLKLHKAKTLLEETNLSLRNISYSLGFESEIYFSQFFKRKTGVTPGSYRENSRLSTELISN